MKQQKKQHGGRRPGSGNKPKYGEPTITVAYRIPKSAKDDLDEVVDKLKKAYQNKNKGTDNE